MTNTTPLITLAGIALLELLPLLYGQVWAPRPYITQMQSQGRRFHPDLIARFLEEAGE